MSLGTPLSAAPPAPAAPAPSYPVSNHPAPESGAPETFSDRRRSGGNRETAERRQFGSSHAGLSPAAKELAVAIDRYKLAARRRYITCEEMLAVITQLGYRRDAGAEASASA